MSLKSVIPSYPENPENQYQSNNYLKRVSYKPPCSQYNNAARGGIIYSTDLVYGTCSPNEGGAFNPPYDFVCDRFGRNCKSPSNPYGQIYRDIDTFCCFAGNSSTIPQPPPQPVPINPVSRCCNMDLNSCAKCLSRIGVTQSSNPTVNHFANMQLCKKMCGGYNNFLLQ